MSRKLVVDVKGREQVSVPIPDDACITFFPGVNALVVYRDDDQKDAILGYTDVVAFQDL